IGLPATLQSLSLSWNPSRPRPGLIVSRSGAPEAPAARPSTAGWWMGSVAPEGARRRGPFVLALAFMLLAGFGASELLGRHRASAAASSEPSAVEVPQRVQGAASPQPQRSAAIVSEPLPVEGSERDAAKEAVASTAPTARPRSAVRRAYRPVVAPAASSASAAEQPTKDPPTSAPRGVDAWDSSKFGGRY
ncbi:MAG TPA: hypothetical protein VFZ53_32415, partial [Polyangiaceae bacterium]